MDWAHLPPELLAKIFRAACLAVGGYLADLPLHGSPHGYPARFSSRLTQKSILFSTAQAIALVCSHWRNVVISDQLLKLKRIHIDTFRHIPETIEKLGPNDSIQLLVFEPRASAHDPVNHAKAMAFFEKYNSQIQSVQVTADDQATVAATFLSLGKLALPRLNLFEYIHDRVLSRGVRVPSVSLQAHYLSDMMLEGVRVDPTHFESWKGFLRFAESAESLKSLTLRNFHPDKDRNLTELALEDHEMDLDTEAKLNIPSLRCLILSGSPPFCVILLSYMETKQLQTLAIRAYDKPKVATSDITSFPTDSLHGLKKLIIGIFDEHIDHLLMTVQLPAITELSIGCDHMDEDTPISLPEMTKLEHIRLDLSDTSTNETLKAVLSSPSSSCLHSMTLGLNVEKTACIAFRDITDSFPNIKSLTLFGKFVCEQGFRDILPQLPNVESLRIIVPSNYGVDIATDRLLPPLFHDAEKSIPLLSKISHLSFFIGIEQPSSTHGAPLLSPYIKSYDCMRLTRYLEERNSTPGFRRIERLLFNHHLTETVRRILEGLVGSVISLDEGGDDEHPWRLDGLMDGKML